MQDNLIFKYRKLQVYHPGEELNENKIYTTNISFSK